MTVIPTDPAPIMPAILRDSLFPVRARMRKLRKGIIGMRARMVDIC
jgi:hypothetical protein